MKQPVKISKSSYTREAAFKSITKFGRIMYKLGVINIYLDYQVWKPAFRWYHPIAWIIILVYGVIGFFDGIIQFVKVSFAPFNKKVKYINDAPPFLRQYKNILVEPLNEHEYEKAKQKNGCYYARSVMRDLTSGYDIELRDFVEMNNGDKFCVNYIYVMGLDDQKFIFLCSGVEDRKHYYTEVKKVIYS